MSIFSEISVMSTTFQQVATWIDETLSSIASKLEHSAQSFSEFSVDKVVSVHTCSLYTCAQMSSGALYWWYVFLFSVSCAGTRVCKGFNLLQ